ncbi:MAG: hypothetical protein ACI8S6_001971 [Myxococcota bacterium]
MVSWLLLSALATAGDKVATTCQVVFMGPTRHCSWSQTLAVSGTGPNEKKAARAATERLMVAVGAMAQARVLQTEGTLAAALSAPELLSCPAAVEDGLRLSCFPDLELERPVTCFADFKDSTCWEPQMVIREGIGWKAREEVHNDLCEQVSLGLSDELDPAGQQSCVARCVLEANVRCPGLASSP